MSERDIVELNQLAYRYAAAVDACDVEAFLAVFTSDARMRVYNPDTEEPFGDMTGHEQLASIPNQMRGMYRKTAHSMTNHLVDVAGETATGQVLCCAKHLYKDPANPAIWVVTIRYHDHYVKTGEGWRISDRQIRFLWNERSECAESGL